MTPPTPNPPAGIPHPLSPPSRPSQAGQPASYPEPRFITVQAAAKYLSVSAKTLRAWIASGFIQSVHLPTVKGTGANRFVRIDRTDLDSLMQKRKALG